MLRKLNYSYKYTVQDMVEYTFTEKDKHMVEENIKRFEELMGSFVRDGKEELMAYIREETDFYTAPASTKYHLSC